MGRKWRCTVVVAVGVVGAVVEVVAVVRGESRWSSRGTKGYVSAFGVGDAVRSLSSGVVDVVGGEGSAGSEDDAGVGAPVHARGEASPGVIAASEGAAIAPRPLEDS